MCIGCTFPTVWIFARSPPILLLSCANQSATLCGHIVKIASRSEQQLLTTDLPELESYTALGELVYIESLQNPLQEWQQAVSPASSRLR